MTNKLAQVPAHVLSYIAAWHHNEGKDRRFADGMTKDETVLSHQQVPAHVLSYSADETVLSHQQQPLQQQTHKQTENTKNARN